MPSLSASSHSSAQALWSISLVRAAVVGLMITGLTAGTQGCRDTREDASYCSSCTSENPDGTATGAQDSASIPPGSGTSVKPGPATTTTPPKGQAGTGNAAQGASNAATSAGTSASGGNNGGSAGARPEPGGAAARGGNTGNSSSGGKSGRGPEAANGGNSGDGPTTPRDAGSTDPEPTPDAGQPAPLPCNGSCPSDRPVCDESPPIPICVQCTADNQVACIGATSTCDVTQRKCVQCTREDVRNCDGETAVCNSSNRCVACTSDQPTSCPPAQSVCDDEKRCVECTASDTTQCSSERSLCNADGKCVACMNNAQCTEPALPRCDTQANSCVGCDGPSDCGGRFPNAPYCDRDSKKCVACSPTGDATCRVGEFCDPNSFVCVPGEPKLRNCETCSRDEDCAQSPSIAACVEVAADNAKYCFAATPSASPRCEPGFTPLSAAGRPNILYCMPVSSCTAIANALVGTDCTGAGQCGRSGVCPTGGGDCTLQCSPTQACPAPLTCDTLALCKKP